MVLAPQSGGTTGLKASATSLHTHTLPLTRMLLRSSSDPDACVWLPGARLNIAQCALSGCRRRRASQAGVPCAGAAAGRSASEPAVIYAEDGRPGEIHSMSLGELRGSAAHIAACIRAAQLDPGAVHSNRALGLQQDDVFVTKGCDESWDNCLHLALAAGDAIAMVMPMTVDSVVIYLGIVLAGCAVVSM